MIAYKVFAGWSGTGGSTHADEMPYVMARASEQRLVSLKGLRSGLSLGCVSH